MPNLVLGNHLQEQAPSHETSRSCSNIEVSHFAVLHVFAHTLEPRCSHCAREGNLINWGAGVQEWLRRCPVQAPTSAFSQVTGTYLDLWANLEAWFFVSSIFISGLAPNVSTGHMEKLNDFQPWPSAAVDASIVCLKIPKNVSVDDKFQTFFDSTNQWVWRHLALAPFLNILEDTWVCLKMLCTPLYPMVLLIIIPMKNGYFIGNIPKIFRQTHIWFIWWHMWMCILSLLQFHSWFRHGPACHNGIGTCLAEVNPQGAMAFIELLLFPVFKMIYST